MSTQRKLASNGYTPTGWNYYITDHLGSTRMVVGSDNSIKETINYYPFGSEMRMEAPAQMSSEFLQPYRFTGKELDRLNGLNMYDFGARWYDVAGVPMWTSVDPLAEKYYHISPYAYCEGNPVNVIDDKGDSTCVLNYGSGSHQHLAMLIQNDEGKWSYYSFNGAKIFNSTFGCFGGAPHNNLGERSFDSPTVFLNSKYNSDGNKMDIKQDKINGYGYTEGYILPTTPEEDVIIKDNFVKAVNKGYNLLTNQCANGVQKALNSVGIKTTTIYNYNHSTSSGAVFPMSPLESVEVNPYLPSKAFKAIRDNNPKGIYIKR